MKWERGHQSPDLIDERGRSPAGAGMLGPLLAIGSRFGIVGLLAAVGLYVGARALLGGSSALVDQQPAAETRAPDERAQFVSFVLDDVQGMWERRFRELGKPYEHAKLVLYTDSTQTGCGFGSAATGPFYCPADQRVFIDLGFFNELQQRFGAPGDFAQAYVIAHELGHHVQHLLGLDTTKAGLGRASRGASGASVRLELQADCFAGIWAHSTEQRQLLETGDVQEALAAAASVGDDRLQRQSTGTVSPESWTHGSSEQRERWFRRGLADGRLESCDTESAPSL